MVRMPHLDWLEAEAIHVIREGVAEGRNPVMLFSAGKDSTVLAHLARQAFYPASPPFPLLHIDSTWEFKSLLEFRDSFAHDHGFRLVVHVNEVGRAAGMNPFDHGDAYTTVMRTDALKQALDGGGYDIVFGGARRDEEKSRAKERIFSIRGRGHTWDPRQQRPELWRLFNMRLGKEQSIRVFPLSNWTESDIWSYALDRGVALAPLYFAKPRPTIERDGAIFVVDDTARMPIRSDETIAVRSVRFRTLGCWPVTAAIESEAADIAAVAYETLISPMSERRGRLGDKEGGGSLERQKRAGYF